MKPFRFGVNVLSAGSRAEWAAKARKIEDLGYAILTVPDHLGQLLAPMPALIAAVEATKHLRVGTNVLNNDFRHPVLVAREAATVDLLTDGRLQLGLGAGYMRSEYEQVGMPFDLGGTRVERLAEAVAIVKKLFTGEPVTVTGRHYHVIGHTIHPCRSSVLIRRFSSGAMARSFSPSPPRKRTSWASLASPSGAAGPNQICQDGELSPSTSACS